ncbi:unnamed protein product [Pylaiella littoralis]
MNCFRVPVLRRCFSRGAFIDASLRKGVVASPDSSLPVKITFCRARTLWSVTYMHVDRVICAGLCTVQPMLYLEIRQLSLVDTTKTATEDRGAKSLSAPSSTVYHTQLADYPFVEHSLTPCAL